MQVKRTAEHPDPDPLRQWRRNSEPSYLASVCSWLYPYLHQRIFSFADLYSVRRIYL